MIFTEISIDELLKYQDENDIRYFFSQKAKYAELAKYNSLKLKILGVKEGDKILAYGIFIYFQHKKIFYKVISQFGPVMDYTNTNLVEFYFSELKKYFAKDLRVVSVIVAPFVNEKFFKDIEEQAVNPLATKIDGLIKKLNYSPMNKDFFDIASLSSRCVFSKDLEGITEENLLKNVSQIGRYTINRTLKEGVLVREIDIENEEDAKIFDDINRDTNNRVAFEVRDLAYFKSLGKILKNDIKFVISYIDCDNFINNTKITIENLQKEKSDLQEKLEAGKVNPKKTNNKIKELDENIGIWEKKIEKIQELKNEEGNIINLSCATFIEAGQDLIYFTSGAMQKFHRYEGPYAVLNHMMKYAIRNNYKYFNFFGTSQDFSENSSDYGVLQFKRNFQGNIEFLMDNYELKNSIAKFINI